MLYKERVLAALLERAKQFNTAFILYTGGDENCSPPPHQYDIVCGFGNQAHSNGSDLKELDRISNKWRLCFLSYDLKNQFEALTSSNEDLFPLPDVLAFEPEEMFVLRRGGELDILQSALSKESWNHKINSIRSAFFSQNTLQFEPDVHRDHYLKTVEAIRQQIIDGDVYELNYCQNFRTTAKLDPYTSFLNIAVESPTPFSCFVKLDEQFALSASMERFLQKQGNRVVSQPIKGTQKRTGNHDEIEKQLLLENEKERAENLMIVDLVRNDLNKHARVSSVKVEELFGIYTYPGVHQMISTIGAEYAASITPSQLIQDLFPMGSMTGAPKLNAMKFIEQHESFKRGLYSGSVGYLTPDGDFDLNVMIRTALYNASTHSVHIPVGSAITYDSVPENEYDECLVKIERLKQLLVAKEE